jgi:hypothetical protein
MSDSEPFQAKPSSWHIAVAAEAIAAAQFARYGLDVSVQYGANQREYDLIVAHNDRILKVSVKGSQDCGWGLTQTFLAQATKESGRKADYHGAVDIWLKRHGKRTVLCFVQFADVGRDEMPRIYLAKPGEVAQRLHETARGRGDSVLHEKQEWGQRAYAAGTVDSIPSHWKFSKERIHQLLLDDETAMGG